MKAIMMTLALGIAGGASETYYNQQHGFSLEIPPGWTQRESAQPNTVVKFVNRDGSDRLAVLSIAAYPDSVSSLTADGMYATFKDEYKDLAFRRVDSGTSKLRSMDAVWNVIEITDPPQAKMIGKHYHFRRNGKLWRVSAMTDSGNEFFASVLPVMEKCIGTIAFGL